MAYSQIKLCCSERDGPPSQRSAIAKNGHVQYVSPDGFFGIHTV